MEIVNPEKLLIQVALILDDLKIDYFITGGLARAVWSSPRSTADIDVVIKILESQVSLLAKALRKISKLGYIDEDTAREAIRKKSEFNFIDPSSGLKVNFWVAKNDRRSLSEFNRRVFQNVEGARICFISPEDLMLNKLEWYKQSGSHIQLEDVGSVFKSLGKKLDTKYLKKWSAILGITDILENLIKNKKAGRCTIDDFTEAWDTGVYLFNRFWRSYRNMIQIFLQKINNFY